MINVKEKYKNFLSNVTEFVFVGHELEKSDIIFIPGNSFGEVAEEAARVYHEGFGEYILPSGRYSILSEKFSGIDRCSNLYSELKDIEFNSEYALLKYILLQRGVSPEAILKEEQASYTYQNAIYSRAVTDMRGMRIDKAILCCQAYHARRCLMYYQLLYPETEFFVHPVVTKEIRADNWFQDEGRMAVVLGEVERCGTQFSDIIKKLQ